MTKNIQNIGIIEKIEAPKIYVRIVQHSACSGCHAKAMCPTSESKIKTIEIIDDSGSFRENEEVAICAHSSMGLFAVFLAFVLPLFLTLAASFLSIYYSENDVIGGIIGLSILVPYFYCIYILRDKLKRKFVFTLSKIN